MEVELWPDLDAYDLRVACGSQVWRVDVKDWHLPHKLAEHLAGRQSRQETVIVIPNTRRAHIKELKQRCSELPYRFMAARDLVREIESVAKGEGNELGLNAASSLRCFSRCATCPGRTGSAMRECLRGDVSGYGLGTRRYL